VSWTLAGFLPLSVLVTDAAFGQTVTLLTGRHRPAEITEWRQLRDPADDPAEIYGQPLPLASQRLLFLPWQTKPDLLPLPEDEARTLFFADEERSVSRMRTAPLLTGGVIAGAVLLALGLIRALWPPRPPLARVG